MAYNFTAASSQYLSTASSPVSTYPFTIAGWANPNTGGVLASISNADGSNRHLVAFNGGTTKVDAGSVTSAAWAAASSINYSANQWNHACGVFESATSRKAYVNGGNEGINTNSANFGTITSAYIATRIIGTAGGFMNGPIAEVGIWNAALTVAEIASLAKGMTCDKVRPQSLVFYAPLVRDLVDVKGGLAITNNNTATVANHLRVYA
jgi:hypothetical protein